MKKNTYNILSSYLYRLDSEDEYKEEYEEIYGETPSDIELSDFISGQVNRDWEDLMYEIDCYEKKYGQSTYVVVASLGLWNGRFDGGKIIKGMKEVIYKCLQDCEEYKIEFKQSRMIITGHHHDGTNCFYIRELKPLGEEYIMKYEYDLDERTLHHRLFKYKHYSKRVTMFDRMYFEAVLTQE